MLLVSGLKVIISPHMGFSFFTISPAISISCSTAGDLIGMRRTAIGRGAIETVLFSIPYDTTDHRFLRIRNDSGNLHMDTASGTGGVPGTYTQQYREAWSVSIPTSAIIFELKAGTKQVEANAPGTVIFDNFVAAALMLRRSR